MPGGCASRPLLSSIPPGLHPLQGPHPPPELPLYIPRPRRGRRFPGALVRRVIEQAVLQAFTVSGPTLWSLTRGRPDEAFARQVAMYLAHVACGLTLTEIGDIFGRDRTTVAHACAVVEDRRDDPVLDRVLELLEGVLRFLARGLVITLPHAPGRVR